MPNAKCQTYQGCTVDLQNIYPLSTMEGPCDMLNAKCQMLNAKPTKDVQQIYSRFSLYLPYKKKNKTKQNKKQPRQMYSRFIVDLASIFNTKTKQPRHPIANHLAFGIEHLAFSIQHLAISMSHVAFHIMKTSMRLRGNGSKSDYIHSRPQLTQHISKYDFFLKLVKILI